MQLQSDPPVHLTYCLSIHPGERLVDVRAALDKAAAVRTAVAPGQPFAVGLRLSAEAAAELAGPKAARFARELDEKGLYVFTINGFPYGPFHGQPVKDSVYAPDWRAPERRAYTHRLAELLASWLPPEMAGSISTVPGSFAPWIRSPADREAVADGLLGAASDLVQIRAQTGRWIRLAVEPEPGCLIDTVDAFIRFFERDILRRRTAWNRRHPENAPLTEATLREHLGLCLDTCHASVQGESIAAAMQALAAADLTLAKIQISAAPRACNTPGTRQRLAAFADPVYLHPLRALLPDGTARYWPDLPDALAALPGLPTEALCTTHVHVPLGWAGSGELSSTRDDLGPDFWAAIRGGATPHLEIETYTFTVLPPDLRTRGVIASVAAEYAWVLEQWRRE